MLHIEPLLRAVHKKNVYGAPAKLNYPAMFYGLVARISEGIPTIKDLVKRLKQDMRLRVLILGSNFIGSVFLPFYS